MGKLECGMQSTQSQQWKNGFVKALSKTVSHKDATIFHYVHCVSLSIFNVLTQVIFSVSLLHAPALYEPKIIVASTLVCQIRYFCIHSNVKKLGRATQQSAL